MSGARNYAKGRDAKANSWLEGPRKPTWARGLCGEQANWACRAACRGCAREAPFRIKNAAEAADKAAKAQSVQGGSKGGDGSNEGAALRQELAQVRAQLRELQQKDEGRTVFVVPDDEDEEVLRKLEGCTGAKSVAFADSLKEELRLLRAQRAATLPVTQQLVRAQRWSDRAKDKAAKAEARLEALQEELVQLQEAARAAEEAKAATDQECLECELEVQRIVRPDGKRDAGISADAAATAATLQNLESMLGKLGDGDQDAALCRSLQERVQARWAQTAASPAPEGPAPDSASPASAPMEIALDDDVFVSAGLSLEQRVAVFAA